MVGPVLLSTFAIAFLPFTVHAARAGDTPVYEAAGSGAQQTPPPGSNTETIAPDLVVIDGSLEPERIPEYALWRDVFSVIAYLKRERESKGTPRAIPMMQLPDGTRSPVELSDRDADVLEAEAAKQRERNVACDVELQRIIRRLTEEGRKPDEMSAALIGPIIECRWKDLEARDRVLSRMSEEGAAQLKAWVNSRRYTMTMSVTKRELPYVMLPQ